MSKELQAFRDILGILSAVSGCEVDMNSERIITVQQALKRLESIDNAEPSEALECVEYIENKLKDLEYIAKKNDNEYLLSKYIASEKFTTIKQALLKAQENARSEEILQKYYQEGITLDSVRALKKEMAELKKQAQEPKHYLKWEDLEFDNNASVKKHLKVKLGDNIYKAYYHFCFLLNSELFCIENANENLNIYITNKQFFNDLHLEVLE